MQIHIEATQLDPYDAGGISETCPDSGAEYRLPHNHGCATSVPPGLDYVLPMHLSSTMQCV